MAWVVEASMTCACRPMPVFTQKAPRLGDRLKYPARGEAPAQLLQNLVAQVGRQAGVNQRRWLQFGAV